ncbi:Holliday junction branch migration protein RuvA [Marinicauda algicola]|uniref:Holliday junction branch migration complex subunit RuvA n=1 Tax=Marinicauda algicola TaxID=2029849 RepID=A0A4V3RYG9_9PROT|nr:Holliday junction branch migration protein RuvA [Marinicauda algicola]TGY90259.1 Holliday junction branch migration protein RuvA [Marinicauda algicola]
MIGKLKGIVDAIGEDELVLDVAGVGYLVTAGARTLARLEPGGEAVLHIETYVREDVFRLYGFLDDMERAWFVRLQSVQGVGAKHALAMLDAVPAGEIENAAALGDASTFERAKGVGKKLAQRIAAELKDKAPPTGRQLAGRSLAAVVGTGKPASAAPAEPSAGAAREGAVSALVNLGYGESEARQAAAAAARTLGAEANEAALIRTALKELAR